MVVDKGFDVISRRVAERAKLASARKAALEVRHLDNRQKLRRSYGQRVKALEAGMVSARQEYDNETRVLEESEEAERSEVLREQNEIEQQADLVKRVKANVERVRNLSDVEIRRINLPQHYTVGGVEDAYSQKYLMFREYAQKGLTAFSRARVQADANPMRLAEEHGKMWFALTKYQIDLAQAINTRTNAHMYHDFLTTSAEELFFRTTGVRDNLGEEERKAITSARWYPGF